MPTTLSRFLLCLFAFLLGAAGASAQDMGALRQRMQERLPQLDALKAEGVIGETAAGYVAVRTENAAASALVNVENADRKVVYAAIAKQTGADADSVGQARARQIAANSAKGVWLRDAGGRWYRKE